MSRVPFVLVAIALLLVAPSTAAQVVETEPDPPRTTQSVTVYFNADEGNGGLEDYDGAVYAHTGISTDQNPDQEWKCVKNYWPTDESFTGNRDDTQLTQVGTNRYKLEISDIRAFYQNTDTQCDLADDEAIETMNFVFRNADGSREGKTQGGGDIFVEVYSRDEGPFLRATIEQPDANPPLYPFITQDDAVQVKVTADTANVDALNRLRLLVDGTGVDSTTADSLVYRLETPTPTQREIRVEAEASSGGETLTSAKSTRIIRAPEVRSETRPSDIQGAPGEHNGIHYNSDGSVTLSLYAPGKDFVYAIGDFSNWEIDSDYFMKKDGDHWWIALDGLSANRQYDFQYLVDGEIRTSDPFAHKIRSPQDDGISQDIYPGLEPYPGDQTENLVSVIRPGQEAPSFTYPDFQPPEREELVIYELLVRDFLEESSYRVLADTLDYLDSLGVNAVELMPVSNFGGNNSWGYNPNAHRALDKAFGTPAGFRQFVEEAHRRDIAVILDVVYNHITDQSPLVQLYGVTAENPFLETEPDRGICGVFFRELNQGSTFIKNYIDRANRYWIENFNVDGFRYDLAKCVADDGVNINDSQHSAAVEDGWKRVADRVWSEVDPNTLMILEFFGGSDVENALGSYGGDGNTAGMMTWHNMNQPYSQADMGYTQGGDISSDFTDAYYGNRSGYDQPSFIAYMESHDEQWLMRRKKAFGNASDDYSTQELPTALERQKLAGAFYFTLPGPRMMWQFGELGYGWGEDECLQEDSGSGGACSSSDPGRTAPKPVRWEYRDPEQHPGRVKLYEAWSALINLRNSEEVFTSLQTGVNMKAGNGDVGRRIVLQHESMDAVVFGNFGVRPQDVNPQFPTSGTWYDFFTGTAVNINADETSTPVPLAPGEFHVFTSEPVPTPDSGLVPFPSVAPPPEPPSNLRSQTGEEEIALSWSGSPSSDLTGYALYRGTAADFDTTGQQIARLPSGTTSYKDRSAEAGTTYYYRLVALDADGERSVLTTAAAAVLYPQRVGFRVERSFARGERPQDYRLVALPGQIDRTLAQTLPGSAGEAWQAYWDDGTETDFLVQFDGSDTFRFRPGRGFWLISDSTWSVQAEVESVSLQEGNTTTIDLHDGWNIIANPFDQGVAWSEVQAANDGSLQPIWAFNGSFRRETRFQSARRGEAFYFRNDGGLDRLVVPYGATDLQQRSPQKRLERPRPSILRLRAEQAGRASVVRLGLSRDAKPDVDALDWVAPPSRFSALSLRSVRGASVTGRQQVLARDVRTPTEEGVTFDLRLATAEQSPVTISAKSLSAIDAQAVRLVNAGTDRVYDLRRQKTVTVRPSDANSPLTLVAGTEAYVQDQQDRLTASELKLDSGYPNPFRQQTTISYTLPEEGVVTLEIFDVLGRRVRTLVDERKEAGPHTVVWRGGNEAGQSVSSGVYLGRLSFDGKTRTQKLVVVK